MSCQLLGFQKEIRKYKLLELTPKNHVENEWFFGLKWEACEKQEAYETFAKKIGCSNTFKIVELV